MARHNAPETESKHESRNSQVQHVVVVFMVEGRRTVINLGVLITAGVPLELVQRATGHRTVEVVMKHHFRPGHGDFRQVLVKVMPNMSGEGLSKTPKGRNARHHRARDIEGLEEG